MSYKQILWDRFSALAQEANLEVFDIETPSGSDSSSAQGFIKVFITRMPSHPAASGENANSKTALTVDVSDCVRLSKVILNLPDVEDLLPGECQLEVSSPGVNRKLSRSDHFKQAVGERLRLVVKNQGEKKEVLRGMLLSFNGTQLEIEEELKKARQVIDYNNITEARVDFNFNN